MWAPTVQCIGGHLADGCPRMEFTHQEGGPQRGLLLLACVCAAWAWYNKSSACVSCVSSVRRRRSLWGPSLPSCPRSHGSWVLGLDVSASAGPHTLPENPSLADPSGLQCIYIVLPMRTPTRPATTTTCPCPHGLRSLTSQDGCPVARRDSRALVLNGRLPDPSTHSSPSRSLD